MCEQRLRDGTAVALRPIRPDDDERLHRMFHRLSPDTVYLRFFAPVRHPTASVLHYLTSCDGVDRLAVVAERDGELVGVARCDRVAPTEADLAVVVEDAWQGRGLGSVLLARLADTARRVGITTFAATMLPENRRASEMARSVPGAELRYRDGELSARIPVSNVARPLGPLAHVG